MSRWLLASVIALLLSCLGFAAAAQGASTAPAQACLHVQAHDAAPDSDMTDPAAAHAEAGVDFAEAAPAGRIAFEAERQSQAASARVVGTPPSPLLDRPKRPPRGSAITA